MNRQQVNDIIDILNRMHNMFTLIVEGQVSQEVKREYLLQLKSVVDRMEKENTPFEITAAMVKELREQTGEGLMNCKKALVHAKGNVVLAKEWLR